MRSIFSATVVVLVSAAALAQQASQAPQTAAAYLQVLTSSERKDYEELKADWEKRQNTDPSGFKKLRAQVTLHSQVLLGEFGYGTLFTGTLDDRTKDAPRAYQAKKGLPISGDVDPMTYWWLTKDEDAAQKRVTVLPAFKLSIYDDYLSADGVWDVYNEHDTHVETTHLECYKDRGVCLQTDAIQWDILGTTSVSSRLTEYQVIKWDAFELIAEDTTPDCERDQLLVNRQAKSVMAISTPTYKSESCKTLLGKPETVTYHLLDGLEIYKTRTAAAQRDKSNLYQFSPEARKIIDSK